MKRTLLILTLGLVLAGTASAATAPPYYWYTAKKANRALVSVNPQLWKDRDGNPLQTTVLTSVCKGTGSSKLYRHLHYYRAFSCRASLRNEAAGPDSAPFVKRLNCSTTKARPYGLKCAVAL